MTYKTAYRLIQARRFGLQTLMICIFQFLIIINLHFFYPALPMYPPIGTAFTLFYLFGANAFFGLAIAGFAAYYLKGFPIDTILLYLTADLFPAYLGSRVTLRCLSSDIIPFQRWQECLHFLRINAAFCLLSAAIRLIPLLLHGPEFIRTGAWNSHWISVIALNFIDLWLSDLNAVLIFSAFLMSWAYLPFSRQRLFPGRFPTEIIIAIIVIILLSILGMHYLSSISLIFFAMLGSLILSYRYGYLVATALLFIVSSLYLTFFMVHLTEFVKYFGLAPYTLVSVALLCFALAVLYTGHRKSNQY